MFSNFTEETCTGTGATLALAGATTGKIAFSESFADGDLVAYALEDSGGTIKVSGIGTYVSATDDITRNDTWNWNGTAVDKSPSTNITLSGGTHTVRCDVVKDNLFAGRDIQSYLSTTGDYDYPDNLDVVSSTSIAVTADKLYFMSITLLRKRVISNLAINVVAADATETDSLAGFYSVKLNGEPDELLFSVSFDATTTGLKEVALSSAVKLDAGMYYAAYISDAAPSIKASSVNEVKQSLFGVRVSVPRCYQRSLAITSGWTEMPANPTAPTVVENYSPILFWN